MVKSIRVEVRFLKKENEESKHGSECAFRRCALKLTGLCAGGHVLVARLSVPN
jgi:hypothetical protein